jgi:integrase
MYQFTKPSKKAPEPLFTGFKQMTDNYLRESVFKRICAILGVAKGKVPYGARHTFSNKLKEADGADIDKARLIGHSDYRFTQQKYQSDDLDDLFTAMKSIK